jgi:hypothetical protein
MLAERLELAADVVGAGTGFHADQAGGHVGQTLSEPESGDLDPQHDGSALILTDEVEAFLPRSMLSVAMAAEAEDRDMRRTPLARSPTAYEQAG